MYFVEFYLLMSSRDGYSASRHGYTFNSLYTCFRSTFSRRVVFYHPNPFPLSFSLTFRETPECVPRNSLYLMGVKRIPPNVDKMDQSSSKMILREGSVEVFVWLFRRRRRNRISLGRPLCLPYRREMWAIGRLNGPVLGLRTSAVIL